MCYGGRACCCDVLIASVVAVRERDDWSDKFARRCEKSMAELAAWAKSPGILRVFQAAIRRPRGRVLEGRKEGGRACWMEFCAFKDFGCKVEHVFDSVRCMACNRARQSLMDEDRI